MFKEAKSFVPFIPCMDNPNKLCEECPLLGTNVDSMRKMLRMRSVKYIFNHEGIDIPTIQNMVDLLRGLDDKYSMIYSDALDMLIPISKPLRKMGKEIAKVRKQYIQNYYADGNKLIECPHFE